MLNEINNQYIRLSNNLILLKSKNAINLVIDNRSQGEGITILEIDEISMYILTEINGLETISQFIIRFCNEYNLDYTKDYSWIFSSIIEMQENDIIGFYWVEERCELKIVGDDNLISPLSATLEVTTKCNLSCQHCYINGDITNRETIRRDQFKSLIQTLQDNNVINIELTGGEFFTHPDALEILELSLQTFSIVGLLTNGVWIPAQAIDLIASYKHKTIVNISVDSTIAKVHDEFRGAEGSHARTLNNLRKLTDKGIRVRVSAVLFKENMWELEKLVELAKEYNASMFTYSFIEKVGRGMTISEIEFDSPQAIEEYMDYINMVTLKNKDFIPVTEQDSHSDKNYCGAGARSIVIDGNGDIRPCVLFPKNKLFGNLLNDEYPTVFEQEIYQQMINLKAPDIEHGCDSHCVSLKHCKGCIFHAFDYLATNDTSCPWIESNNYQRLNEMIKPIFQQEMEK